MKNKIIVHVTIGIVEDGECKFESKQTTLVGETKNAAMKHTKPSKMSFLGGSYAYTEEDGLYPILS